MWEEAPRAAREGEGRGPRKEERGEEAAAAQEEGGATGSATGLDRIESNGQEWDVRIGRSVPDRCGPVEMVANGISGGKSADTKGRQGEEEPALPEECACAGRGGRVEVVVGRMPGAVGGGEKGEEESLAQHVGPERRGAGTGKLEFWGLRF